MRILFTGASSFTGFWFARALAEAGHEVTATLSGADSADSYRDTRAQRVQRLCEVSRVVFDAPFGSIRFLDTMKQIGEIDVLCHHWSEVRNYRSSDFDAGAALKKNTFGLDAALSCLANAGGGRVILTGSVFEYGEGAGSEPLEAFSPYGLSKGLTARMFAYYCRAAGMRLQKFVIPNPFGPWEEPRFTNYLMRTWFARQPALVSTPLYVRDNIHVSLLARAYAAFVSDSSPSARAHFGPSGYVETQAAFAERAAREVRARLPLDCTLRQADQTEFPEPMVRTNRDAPDLAALRWSESAAWDEFVEYYREKYAEIT